MDRITIGRMQNPVRGLLHGGAALAALVGTVYLVATTRDDGPALAATLVFGTSLLVMYTVSAFYHSVPWGEVWKRRLQRVDHSMIYLLVAGTWTPLAVAALDGPTLWLCLGPVWAIASIGIIVKLTRPNPSTRLSVTLQLVMGWAAVLWMPLIWSALGAGAIAYIGLGGLFYTVGAVFFLTKRPRLSPRIFSYHELFHVFVVLASVAHFMAIARYAVPALV